MSLLCNTFVDIVKKKFLHFDSPGGLVAPGSVTIPSQLVIQLWSYSVLLLLASRSLSLCHDIRRASILVPFPARAGLGLVFILASLPSNNRRSGLEKLSP